MTITTSIKSRQFPPNSLCYLIKLSNLPLFAYIGVQIQLLLTHESWRDEVSPWLQTQNSSWAEVAYKSQLELQSPFFFSLLKLLHLLSDDFWTYRCFLFLLTVGSAFIIKSLCSNSWRLQLLIYSNYYIIYEYSAIQRVYTISLFLLLVFVFCLRKDLSSRKSISSLTKIALLLLSIVSIWTLMLSIVVVFTLIYSKIIPMFTRFIFVHLGVTITQLIFLFISKDRDWGVRSNTRDLVNLENLVLIFTAPIRSMIFIPESTIKGWNTNVLFETSLGFVITLHLTLLYYMILLLYILRRNYIGLHWLLSISAFAILVGLGKQRHLGQMFLLMVTIASLEVFIFKRQINFSKIKSRFSSGLFIILLLLSVTPSSVSILRDVKNEFSTSSDLYTFIEEGDLLIVQDSGKNTYLPLVLKSNRNVFSIFGGSYSHESLLNKSSRSIPNDLELSRKFQEVCLDVNPKRILLFTDRETRRYFQEFSAKLISRSRPAIVENEGERELWLLAWRASDVKKLCLDPYSAEFFSKIKTEAVGYGG